MIQILEKICGKKISVKHSFEKMKLQLCSFLKNFSSLNLVWLQWTLTRTRIRTRVTEHVHMDGQLLLELAEKNMAIITSLPIA